MKDHTWTVDTGRDDGGIVTNGIVDDSSIPPTPDMTRGKDVQFVLGFWDEVGIQTHHIDRYEALRDYGDFAGSATVNQGITGQPSVIERVPAQAAVDSIIVDFEPGRDVDHAQGFWGVITGMEDQTTVPADMGKVQVSATVLADATDYADRAELKADISGGLP